MAERSLVQPETRPFLLQGYSLKGLPQPREWGLQFKAAALAALALGITALVALLYLVQASEVATTSYDIRETEGELARLERDNALLSYQVAQLSNPGYVLDKALKLGLTTTLTLTYLSPKDIERELTPSPPGFIQGDASTGVPAMPPERTASAEGARGRWYVRLAGWARGRFQSATEALAKGPE